MDWKTFIASIVSSLAWPTAIVIVVCIFRDRLKLLLGQIRKIGAAGVNLELSERIADAVDAGNAVATEKGLAPSQVTGLDPRLLELAERFPSAALVQAFRDVEASLMQIQSHLKDGKPHRAAVDVIRALRNKRYISPTVEALYDRLREARNAAAHGKDREDLSPVEVIELISQAKLLQDALLPVLEQVIKDNKNR